MPSTLKDFVGFIQTIWGILAGITAFFPLFSSFIHIVPAPQSRRVQTSTFGTIGSCFSLYFAFLMFRVKEPLIPAVLSLLLMGLAIFCFLKATDSEYHCRDIQTMLFSILTFMSLTGAFSILAAFDFWRGR